MHTNVTVYSLLKGPTLSGPTLVQSWRTTHVRQNMTDDRQKVMHMSPQCKNRMKHLTFHIHIYVKWFKTIHCVIHFNWSFTNKKWIIQSRYIQVTTNQMNLVHFSFWRSLKLMETSLIPWCSYAAEGLLMHCQELSVVEFPISHGELLLLDSDSTNSLI